VLATDTHIQEEYPLKTRFLSLTLVIALLSTFLVAPLSAGAQTNSPFTVNLTDFALGGGYTFTGAVDIDRFAVQGTQIVAIGTIEGVVENAAGVVGTVDRAFRAVVTSLSATCQILNLDIGPIDLNLLGLLVDISPISIDITAVSGPGNLLGNLLCGLAGLLDQPSTNTTLQGIVQILNNLLRILG
jgi:hypothetical protein